MLRFDFLSIKTIFRYLLIVTVTLLGGIFLKEGIALLFVGLIVYYCITRNLYRAVETFFIWFFLSNFFIGQGYLTNEFIIKYIAKPHFLLFVIFLFFLNKIPKKILQARYIYMWFFFLLLTLLSSVTQGQSPFVIITISGFFIMYLLMQAKGITHRQNQNILNLFVAVAISQTIVSILQVTELIPASSKVEGGEVIIMGLDDVASGTFGAASSHLTSWYAALISLFLLLMWLITKNNSYLLFIVISFLQFATVDSKTIMGVTILMLGFTILYVFKGKKMFRISIGKYVLIIFIFAVGIFGFYAAWDSYYQYFGNKTGGTRTSINEVYKSEVVESTSLILTNIADWGKIRGYQYVVEDYIMNNPVQLIWGYGIQGYEMNGKGGYILEKDTPLMKLNNLTNNRSGLIRQFAVSGFLGFILFFYALGIWYAFNRRKILNNYDLLKDSLLKIFLVFTIVAAFLYSIEISSIPVMTFSAIVSIYMKTSTDSSNKVRFLKDSRPMRNQRNLQNLT